MTPEQRLELAALLSVERDRLVAVEAELAGEHRAIVEASAYANLDDEHDPEGATVGFERARTASLLAHIRGRLVELSDASERLRSGAYGTCRRCGEPIAFQRLAAHPTAVCCIDCADEGGTKTV